MIDLQHALLESLGIHHLYMVMGTSMGGMHTWMWGERWPDAMDALVPLASAPAQIAGRNRMWRKMAIDDLERGDLPAAIQILMIATGSPLQWQKSAPTGDDADRWLAEQMKTRVASTDADDLCTRSMRLAITIRRRISRRSPPLLAINSADDFVNPPEMGIMEKAIARVPHGRYVLIPTSDRTRGHGTHTWPELWQGELARFLGERPAGPQ